MLRGVRAGVAFVGRWWRLRLRAARCGVSRPCERVLFSPCYAQNIDQLLDDLLQRVVVQLELSPQHPQGQTTVLLEVTPYLTDDVEKVHRADSASSGAMRSACPVAPISTKRRW